MERLQEESLNWAITHIRKFGDTDIFPVPFEYTAIHQQWQVFKDYLLDIDLETYETRALVRYLIPKPLRDYRVAIRLDPIDTILYTAMIYEAADLIENYRITIEQRISCSYRVEKDASGKLFKTNNGWDDFRDRSQELADSGDFSHVLIADLTDFYNQVSHHRIVNALEDAEVPPPRAKAIERFLGNLTAKHHSRGIPVGPYASILLAEACLNDVDSKLIRGGYIHSRFVDDFRVFCKSRIEAQRALHDLSEYLYTAHRLSLQTYKTRIITVERFKEKELLDPEKIEEQSKTERLSDMLSFLSGYGVEPEDIEQKDIDKEIRANLRDLFSSCLEEKLLPLGLARFLLRRATSLKTNVLQEQVIENLTKLLPVFRDVMIYLEKTTQKKKYAYVGESLFRYLTESEFSFLPYVKLWITHLLISKFSEKFEAEIVDICRQENDTRHLAIMARERKHLDWVREQKEIWNNYNPWARRAIIWSAPVLPGDERRHWLRSIENAGDKLDHIVAKAAHSLRKKSR